MKRKKLIEHDDHRSDGGNGARDGHGRFGKGNRFASGRRTPRAEWGEAVEQEVRVEDIRRLIRRMIEQGVRGDVRAAGLVLERCLGRVPVTEQEPMQEFHIQADEVFL